MPVLPIATVSVHSRRTGGIEQFLREPRADPFLPDQSLEAGPRLSLQRTIVRLDEGLSPWRLQCVPVCDRRDCFRRPGARSGFCSRLRSGNRVREPIIVRTSPAIHPLVGWASSASLAERAAFDKPAVTRGSHPLPALVRDPPNGVQSETGTGRFKLRSVTDHPPSAPRLGRCCQQDQEICRDNRQAAAPRCGSARSRTCRDPS
jgi:hypothetical protein